MELVALKAQIKSGQLNRLYVFTGPEVKAMDIYIEQMSKRRNAQAVRLDSVEDLIKKTRSKSFVKMRHIYILRDSAEFLSDDKIKTILEQNNAFLDDIIIFIYSQIDKRSKLYKSSQDIIVNFEPLKDDILKKYIKKVINLNDTNCMRLIDICESDYSRILLEIDKIKQFQQYTDENTGIFPREDDVFNQLLKDGTIYVPPYDAVFDFVDAVLKYKPKLAFRLLQESYDSGEATMVLLSNLYNSTKQLLQYQSYRGKDMSNATGLTPFQMKLASGRQGIYSNGDLVYFMRQIREAEKGIKTGEIEESIAVPYVLISLWGY